MSSKQKSMASAHAPERGPVQLSKYGSKGIGGRSNAHVQTSFGETSLQSSLFLGLCRIEGGDGFVDDVKSGLSSHKVSCAVGTSVLSNLELQLKPRQMVSLLGSTGHSVPGITQRGYDVILARGRLGAFFFSIASTLIAPVVAATDATNTILRSGTRNFLEEIANIATAYVRVPRGKRAIQKEHKGKGVSPIHVIVTPAIRRSDTGRSSRTRRSRSFILPSSRTRLLSLGLGSRMFSNTLSPFGVFVVLQICALAINNKP